MKVPSLIAALLVLAACSGSGGGSGTGSGSGMSSSSSGSGTATGSGSSGGSSGSASSGSSGSSGSGSCPPQAMRCAPDGYPCPNGDECCSGTCSFSVSAGENVCQQETPQSCTIDGNTYADGAADPSNPCLACTSYVSLSAWSYNDGASCGDGGAVCSCGACQAGCFIATGAQTGTYYPPGAVDPTNPCLVCDPSTSTSKWSPSPTAIACSDGGQFCAPDGTCREGCAIGGAFHAPGDENPSSACQVCDPSASTSNWSNAFFSPPALVSTQAAAPYAVATGDFDRSGRAELAIGGSGIVEVLRGQTDGGFNRRGVFDVQVQASTDQDNTAIQIADLNGDGTPDLYGYSVYDFQAGWDVFVMYAGDGGFAQPQFLHTTHPPEAITAADVDGDGRLDLVAAVSAYGTNSLQSFINEGDGGFSGGVVMQLIEFPVPMLPLDENGDGRADFFLGDSATWLLSAPDGGYSTAVAFDGGASSLALGDLDGDGLSDIALFTDQGSVLLRLPDGGFGPPQTLGARGDVGQLVDLDGDGKLDVLGNQSPLTLLLNHSTPGALSFQATSIPALGSGAVRGVAAGDVDGDGDPEVIVAGPYQGQVAVLHRCQ